MILVTGFGAFSDAPTNPAETLVRRLTGRRVLGETVLCQVLPVSYWRGPGEALALAALLQPRLVVGVGVAVRRSVVSVEVTARPETDPEKPDVDGQIPGHLKPGPDQVRATVDVSRLAQALDAELSEDAGDYVCNAWLYRVVLGLPQVPVGFVHIPPTGLDPDLMMRGLAALIPTLAGSGRPSSPDEAP